MTSKIENEKNRLTSGILGLDTLLHGGFVKGGVYLLLGPPGAGKTIFANQICFHHASKEKSNIVYVTLLAESHGRMMENLRSLKYFEDEEISKSIHYMGGYHVLEKEGLKGFLRLIAGIVKEKNASILMIDGMSTIGELEHSAITFRKFAHELNSYLSSSGCTAFLLSSMEGHLSKPEHTMVDGILSFHYENIDTRVLRQIEVRKFRGSGHLYGKHLYKIDEEGIKIFPKLESTPKSSYFPVVEPERITSGIKNLDKMLCGGLYRNSMTTVIGSAGTGKTSMAIQFLTEGAQNGENGVFFGFYETPLEIVVKAEKLSLDLKASVKKKKVEIIWRAPLEQELDELAFTIIEAVKRTKAKRIVIDGMDGFRNSVLGTERLYRFIPALILELKHLGVTIFLVEEISTFDGPERRMIGELSAINETVLYLHHEDVEDEIATGITVLKMRNSGFDKKTRFLKISDKGLSISDSLKAPEALVTNASPAKKKKKASKGRK